MKLFGFEITRTKAAAPLTTVPSGWSSNFGLPFWQSNNAGWFPLVQEPFTGAWQRNQELRGVVLGYSAVYACVTLIASDVAKLPLRLMRKDDDDLWEETTSPAFSPVLRKPNHYQNRIKFIEQWIISKLLSGNTYIIKERDARGVVVALYVLDPWRTKVLVAPDGSVFYELGRDDLSGLPNASISVPATEIIHDIMVALYHPLCGVSPITACGLAAAQGMSIQRNSTAFFEQGSNPGGILTAPGPITDDQARALKERWHENYSGANVGKVAVLGNGLKFEKMSQTAVDSQLIEQLRWTAETVCSCFHVPPYMIGVGPMPQFNNIEALNQQYYTQCLQSIIESIELCLDEGLGLVNVTPNVYGSEFDVDELLRMDSVTKTKNVIDGIKGGLLKPNEGRKKFGLEPVTGGDDCYLQQQNYSLSALAKRDAKEDPFASKAPVAAPQDGQSDNPDDTQSPDDSASSSDAVAENANATGKSIADDIFSRARQYVLHDSA